MLLIANAAKGGRECWGAQNSHLLLDGPPDTDSDFFSLGLYFKAPAGVAAAKLCLFSGNRRCPQFWHIYTLIADP